MPNYPTVLRTICFHVFIDWYLLFLRFLNSTSLQGTLYVCLIPILFYADRKFLTDAFEKFVYVFSIHIGLFDNPIHYWYKISRYFYARQKYPTFE